MGGHKIKQVYQTPIDIKEESVSILKNPSNMDFYDITVSQNLLAGVDVTGSGGGEGLKSFETVSKNLKAYPATLNYTGDTLTSIDYTVGSSTITKIFNYVSGKLTSIILSGALPSGISTTKTFVYSGDKLVGFNYS